MSENINSAISAILFAGALQGIFLSLVIYKNLRGKTYEAYLLIFTIGLFSLNIIAGGIVQYLAVNEPDYLLTPVYFQLLLGPVFYFYSKSVSQGHKHRPRDVLHIMPFMFFLCFTAFSHILPELIPAMKAANTLLWIFIILQLLCYLFLMKKMIVLHEAELDDKISLKEKYSLGWMYSLVIVMIAAIVIYFALFILIFHGLLDNGIVVRIFSIFLAAMIYFFGYKGLRQKTISVSGGGSKSKYAKSVLSEDYLAYWKEKLIRILENDKPYLDPELSLTALAKKTGLSENNLSQIINGEIGLSFYDLINNYRVEEVKRLLSSDKNANMLDTAFMAGFNSKTAFNTVFKRKTGLTPTQFMRTDK